MKKSNCYCCGREIIENEISISAFSLNVSNGIKSFNFDGLFKDHNNNEITFCRKCLVASLVMTAETFANNNFRLEREFNKQYLN